jgi:uncharacterized protein (TIGR00725 family)
MKYVGVAAYSGSPPEAMVRATREFISELSKLVDLDRTVLVLGGYWGLMKIVVDEALLHGFKVLLFPHESMEGIEFPPEAIVVRSGTSYRVRSVFLVRTSDVLVALGGESGSIQEVVTAYTEGKPIFILWGTGFSTDRLKAFAPYIDRREIARIEIINEPITLAKRVAEALSFKSR